MLAGIPPRTRELPVRAEVDGPRLRAMQSLAQRVAFALTVAAAPLAGLLWPAHGLAEEACGPAMFFNIETNQCEYYAIAGPGPVGPGPVGPGPAGPGPVAPGPVGPGR